MKLIDKEALLLALRKKRYSKQSLDLIESQPVVVKAIPIEWIKSKYREKWEKAEMERRDFQFIEVIDELLTEWEKENADNS